MQMSSIRVLHTNTPGRGMMDQYITVHADKFKWQTRLGCLTLECVHKKAGFLEAHLDYVSRCKHVCKFLGVRKKIGCGSCCLESLQPNPPKSALFWPLAGCGPHTVCAKDPHASRKTSDSQPPHNQAQTTRRKCHFHWAISYCSLPSICSQAYNGFFWHILTWLFSHTAILGTEPNFGWIRHQSCISHCVVYMASDQHLVITSQSMGWKPVWNPHG